MAPWEALALVALSFAALRSFAAAWPAQGLDATVAAEVLCALVPTALVIWWRRIGRAALGLDELRPLAILGGLLAGAGAFYLVAAGVEPWIEHIWPTPPALRQALERMVIPAAGARPLALDLLALALVPAATEELLFRGVVWGALARRLGPVVTLLATALLFGLYHGSVYRLVPVILGGLLLGGVRLASGALLPAVAFHFANNAGVIVALHFGHASPPPHPLPMLVALAAFGLGGALLLVGPRRQRHTSA